MAEGGENLRNRMNLSQKLLSYLEKHRIFELFQELSMMLLIKKPEDHLLFLKQSIHHAARRLDTPRIIILAPPEFDPLILAKILMEKLRIPALTLTNINAEFVNSTEPSFLVEKFRTMLRKYMQMNCDGWIFADFPRTEQEARCFLRAGIIPSHVIDIVYDAKVNSCTPSICRREIRGLRSVYSEFITTIYCKYKKVQDVAQECLRTVKLRKFSRAPAVFRIVLLDSTNTEIGYCMAEQLSQMLDINHIDFDKVLLKIESQETKLAEQIRDAKRRAAGCKSDLPAELKVQAFQEHLIQTESLKKGWILSGHPTTIKDLKLLDLTDSPPNRLVVIVPSKSENSSKKPVAERCSASTRDGASNECLCVSDENMWKMIEYAGETASFIESDANSRVVKERIALNLMQPPPCVPPRQPQPPPAIFAENIEFDPDDEPSTDIFDNIREYEPMLPLL